MLTPPASIAELEELLSRPDAAVLAALRECPGDVVVLGAGGKMGPSLCRMLGRAVAELGDGRRVYAVSRFADRLPDLTLAGVSGSGAPIPVRCDLCDPDALSALPDAANVIHMAGQKFGTAADPAYTWGMNAAVPALVGVRYRHSRKVVFSTGNVYPLVPAASGGASEETQPAPVGEYAQSCLARERVFSFYSARYSASALFLRLNYAVDLRYGVLVDIALRVARGEPVPLQMGYVNVIWQGDANRVAIASLRDCSLPAAVLNVTGTRTLSVRDAASRMAAALGKEVRFVGVEGDDALLSSSARMVARHGVPEVDEETLMAWVVSWVRRGGEVLDRPTHFEERGGSY